MVELAVESTSTVSLASVSTVTLPKPTGLAVGDLMIAILVGDAPFSFQTKSGWTETEVSATPMLSMQYKIADASDVAASQFVFDPNSPPYVVGGCMLRVSDADSINLPISIETDSTTANSTSISFASSVDPGTEKCLIVAVIVSDELTTTGDHTISDITLTPTATLVNVIKESTTIFSYVVQYYIQTTRTNITNYATTVATNSDNAVGIIAAFRPNYPSTGTNALLEVSPTTFTQNGVAGTTGTNELLVVTQDEVFEQSGKGTAPTPWANESKPTTSWNNETL